MPLRTACPNFVPRPLSASAAADSVRFSLTGSTFSEIEVNVSNNVLNSVVTWEASMTSALEIRVLVGFFGLVNETYLLPNTVLALICASTLAGIRSTKRGWTSRSSWAICLPSRLRAETALTRPISTPL